MKIRRIAAIIMATLVLSSGTALAVGQPITPVTSRMTLKSGGVKEILLRGWRSSAHDSVSWKVFNPSVALSSTNKLYFRLRTNENVNQTGNYASGLCTFDAPATKNLRYDKSKLAIGDYWYMCGETDETSRVAVDFSVTYSY